MIETNNTDNKNEGLFLKLLDILIRWRRLLVVNMAAAAVLTFAVLKLFFPNWYAATTTIMPPEKDAGGLGFASSFLPSGLSSLIGGGGLALPGFATPSDLYASVLKSNAVRKAVIDRNDLKDVYDVELDADALLELSQHTSILVQAEGIIILTFEDTDPLRAANVANSYVEELNRVNTENLVSKAKALRQFIEARLEESIRDLTSAEEAFKAFQMGHNAISLDEQIKASINAIADLRAQQILAEIELGVMKKSLSPDNAKYKNQEFKIQQIKMQLEKLEKGDALQDSSILNVSMAEAPELGLQYARLMRELKIQETIFELLKQQYEQAKIQEMKDTPTIQVLDAARPPEKKSRPHRVATALIGAILSFGLTLFSVMIFEFVQFEKEKQSQAYRKIQGITRMVNEDIYWVRSMFGRKRKGDGG